MSAAVSVFPHDVHATVWRLRDLTLTLCPFRNSANETPLDDDLSNDDIITNISSSDEQGENDTSSISSKGEPEQPAESTVRRADTAYDL